MSTEEFWQIAQAILTEEQFADLYKLGSVDFAYDYDDNNRFRVNLFQARGKLSVAARLITSHIRRFDGPSPSRPSSATSRCSPTASCS